MRCVQKSAPLIGEALGPPGDGGDDDVAGAGGRGPPVGRVAGGRQNAAELAQNHQRIRLRAVRDKRLKCIHLRAHISGE